MDNIIQESSGNTDNIDTQDSLKEQLKKEIEEELKKEMEEKEKEALEKKEIKRKKITKKILIALLLILMGLGIYLFMNRKDERSLNTATIEEVKPDSIQDKYGSKFWNGDQSITLADAMKGYKYAKNIEWLEYEKDGRKVFQIRIEHDTSKFLDDYRDSVMGTTNEILSEVQYTYYRFNQDKIKIYDNLYFYIPKDLAEEANVLELSKRELEIKESKDSKVSKNYEYFNDLKDIYEKKPDIEGVAGAMQDYYRNGYYRKSLVYTPDCDCESDELDKIYVLYKTVEEADTQLNNSYNNLMDSMDNEELRKTLIDVEKQWISYKDAEFKTLESSFYLKNEKTPSEVAKKLSEKYKIKVIVDRISELDYLSEILEQGNYPKLDYNEITKEEESLKKLYAGVLNKMNNDGQTKKNLMDSQQKWTIFNESSKKFMQMFPGNTEANYMLVPVSQRKPEIVIYSLLPY